MALYDISIIIHSKETRPQLKTFIKMIINWVLKQMKSYKGVDFSSIMVKDEIRYINLNGFVIIPDLRRCVKE